MKKTFWKDSLRDLWEAKGRFFAIVAIVALGAGFFGGIKATGVDMKLTADSYYTKTKLYDLRVVSTLGLTDADAEALADTEGVEQVIPSYRTDAVVQYFPADANSELTGTEQVIRLHAIPDADINLLTLRDGRLPESSDEVAVVAGKSFADGLQIGDHLIVDLEKDPDMEDTLSVNELTVVGLVDSPLYMSFDTASTNKGSGTINTFVFIPQEAFTLEAYTELYIRMEDSDSLFSFDDAYENAVDAVRTRLEDVGPERCEIRKDEVIAEANEALADGQREYDEKTAEAEQQLADAQQQLDDAQKKLDDGMQELADAKQELIDGEAELAQQQADYEETMRDAREQIAEAEEELWDAELEIADNEVLLNQTEVELQDGKRELNSSLLLLEQGEEQYREGEAQYQEILRQYEENLAAYEENAALEEQLRAMLEQKEQEFALQAEQLRQQIQAAQQQKEKLLNSFPGMTEEEVLAYCRQQINALSTSIAQKQQEKEQALSQISPSDPLYSETEAQYDQEIEKLQEQLSSVNSTLLQIEACSQTIAELEGILADGEAGLETLREQQSQLQQGLESGKAQLDMVKEMLDGIKEELDASYIQLAAGRTQYNEGLQEYEDGLRQWEDGWEQLKEGKQELEDGKKELEKKKQELADGEETAEQEFADARKKLDDGWAEVEEGEQELIDGQAELDEAKATYETEKADAEQKISDAREQLEDAEQQIRDITDPDWYVFDRNEGTGYATFTQDAERVDAVAAVFPVFFFLVAALVVLTTMTRMVEEERTQVGVMKALGYSKAQIIGKYIFYALFTSLIGSVAGLLIGFQVFPRAIWMAYGMMYTTPPIQTPFSWKYAGIAVVFFMLCTVGATLAASWTELMSVPAELIRPKPPKNGKRIFMENISVVWKRMSFTQKLTARNIFRYKKRFFMTVIGIAGCTALMLTGFGLKDSIGGIVTNQFVKLSHYDMQMTFAHKLQEGDLTVKQERVLSKLEEDERVEDYLLISQSSLTTTAENVGEMDVYLFVPEDTQKINSFLTFQVRGKNTPIAFPEEGTILTEKLARELGLKVGDTIELEDTDHNLIQLRVAGICENYVHNYAYISPKQYEVLYGQPCGYQGALVMLNGEGTEFETAFSEDLLTEEEVMSVSFTSSLMENFADVFDRLDMVVVVLIISASLLAFVVLYNLTNINVNERVREIATIKVLGFYNYEVDSYIYRENMILTLLGILVGFVMGIFLHRYVMSVAETNIVMFGREIAAWSYLWSALLTLVFACVVNFVMHFRLMRISMVESLKSIE